MTTKKTRMSLFRRIAEDIKETITSGEAAPGAHLPTEAALCDQYETTRTTVRAAYRELIEEGLVEKRGLSGYFVREIKARQWNLADASALVDPVAMTRNADKGRTREITTVRTARPDKTIRNRRLGTLFGLGDDDLLACRSTVHYRDREPAALTETYIPYALAKDSAFMSDAPTDVLALLRGGGATLAGFSDVTATRVPALSETSFLELPEATPVTEILRSIRFTGADRTERCLMVVHYVFSALGAEFVHDVRA